MGGFASTIVRNMEDEYSFDNKYKNRVNIKPLYEDQSNNTNYSNLIDAQHISSPTSSNTRSFAPQTPLHHKPRPHHSPLVNHQSPSRTFSFPQEMYSDPNHHTLPPLNSKPDLTHRTIRSPVDNNLFALFRQKRNSLPALKAHRSDSPSQTKTLSKAQSMREKRSHSICGPIPDIIVERVNFTPIDRRRQDHNFLIVPERH